MPFAQPVDRIAGLDRVPPPVGQEQPAPQGGEAGGVARLDGCILALAPAVVERLSEAAERDALLEGASSAEQPPP